VEAGQAPVQRVTRKRNPVNILSNPKRSEHDLALAALTQDNEQLGGAGEEVSRANEQASVRSSHAGLALRVFIGLVLTAGFVVAFVEAKLSQEQFARDIAAVAERLTATEARIARDNAQIVEQLKAAQSQMAQDNAALSSELKTDLDQMTRAIDKASESLPNGLPSKTRGPKRAGR
jgi:hypothetical protein